MARKKSLWLRLHLVAVLCRRITACMLRVLTDVCVSTRECTSRRRHRKRLPFMFVILSSVTVKRSYYHALCCHRNTRTERGSRIIAGFSWCIPLRYVNRHITDAHYFFERTGKWLFFFLSVSASLLRWRNDNTLVDGSAAVAGRQHARGDWPLAQGNAYGRLHLTQEYSRRSRTFSSYWYIIRDVEDHINPARSLQWSKRDLPTVDSSTFEQRKSRYFRQFIYRVVGSWSPSQWKGNVQWPVYRILSDVRLMLHVHHFCSCLLQYITDMTVERRRYLDIWRWSRQNTLFPTKGKLSNSLASWDSKIILCTLTSCQKCPLTGKTTGRRIPSVACGSRSTDQVHGNLSW